MLLRKTAWSWKSGLAVISFVLMLSVSGCSDAPPEEDTVSETVIDIQLPMDLVSELPQIAIDCGFTVEDFDYLNMPEKEDDTLTITVTTDAAEKDGIVFQSTDYGATWEYKGLVQIAN